MLEVTLFECSNKAILGVSSCPPSDLLDRIIINLISFASLHCFLKRREDNSLYVKIKAHPDCVCGHKEFHIAESIVKHEGLVLFRFWWQCSINDGAMVFFFNFRAFWYWGLFVERFIDSLLYLE
jgi:hypothetical protein